MSMRGTKRASGVRGEETAGTSKRRRTEPEDALWQLRPVSDLKMSSIYNRSASEAPAELFRKDLISAMKLPDNEPLTPAEYWIITDSWKQDWERGVQVPVSPDSLPAPKVKIIDNPLPPNFQEFKLPKDKFIHLQRDSHYQAEIHHLSLSVARAEASCSYDLDATDSMWLKLLNAERARAGAAPVTEDQLERVLEELEVRTWDKIQAIIKSEEGLGIEYDENVICDVCRSPDSEDGNEMVFCDSCNICVHQACYGIIEIPPGQWMCRPCRDGVRDASCILCPNVGGAMKCTPSGHKWAHVSCVLWIPEVSIGCAEKMEPITKISAIPPSRWALLCVLCRERKGACIQCSVKTCKTAYHVTCAFKHGLEMRAIIEDENADDGVKLRSYCQKHSVNSKKDKSGSGSDEEEVKKKRRKDMTNEEKNQARAARLQEIEREFDKHVSVKDISTHLLDVDQDAIFYIYNYWKLKRRAGHNRPLLPPKSDDADLLSHRQEQADLDKMKMFVQLRQDLERVRNLCYMVSRREKLSRSFFRYREQTFHKQVSVLSSEKSLSSQDLAAIIEANHGPSIYDRLYSHADAPDHKNDFDELLARIAGPDTGDDKKKDINGSLKGSKGGNPYKKHYVNGSNRRSGSIYSGMSSEESAPEISRSASKYRGRTIGSSSDEETPKRKIGSPKKKVSPKTKVKKTTKKTGKKKTPQSKALVETSSEDESMKSNLNKDKSKSKTLQRMEKEMTACRNVPSGSESDDLMPIRTTRNNKFPMDIYSDSENETNVKSDPHNSDKSPSATNDSILQLPRTKAAMKEFIPSQLLQKGQKKNSREPKKRGRKPSSSKEKKLFDVDKHVKVKVDKSKKTKDNPTDLIVPQRQAAKKASENMRSTTALTATKTKDELSDKLPSGDDLKSKSKLKSQKRSKERESPIKEPIKRKSSCDVDKETIAYVPQRQAAKKAAAHIKSGLGSKGADQLEDKKKDVDRLDLDKKSPKKDDDKIQIKSSSSSTSNSSSSSSYSSSSSSDEEEKPEAKPSVKAREIKPVRQSSLFSPTGARPTVDLPFLDKVSRPLSSTSASSDSESSKGSRFSGSDSPVPKRPRRRRKGRHESTDVSPLKAPDKKLKTSERSPMCRVSSPTLEGEKRVGPNDTRAATRARTRSTTTSGNMPDKSDTRQRKSSKDDTGTAAGSIKNRKESCKPSEFSTAERKKDETLIRNKNELSATNEDRSRSKLRRSSTFRDDRDKKTTDDAKTSPTKKVVPNKRPDVKETKNNEGSTITQRRGSRYESPQTHSNRRNSSSPSKKHNIEKHLSPGKLTDNYTTHDKNWFPKASSPDIQPPPIEKPGGHDKYLAEDKSLDSDAADKSSIRMIAKIQANLNENTMIKSPKTPMDARTINMDPLDLEHPLSRSFRKRSLMEAEKKFTMQDASHVQGVEISKSAKIPSAQFPNISIFSPRAKENELFDIDMLGVDEEPFPSYPEPFFLKEDSKEQGVQETLNLVDRLRMQLSSKKVSSGHDHDDALAANEDKDHLASEDEKLGAKRDRRLGSMEMPNRSPYTENIIANYQPHGTPPIDLTPRDVKKSMPLPHIDNWPDLPPTPRVDAHMRHPMDLKYDGIPYNVDNIKDMSNAHSDMQSTSEMDRDTMSKQSDDSQSLSVVDNSVNSNDKESISHDNNNYDNNNSLIHSDCATISSPVSQDKWRESKITHRRSSASSTNSEGSICSHKIESNIRQSSLIPEIGSYPALPAYSCPIETSMPLNQYSTYQPNASPFISSMASFPLFPPGVCVSSGLTLPSPGPGIFTPTLPVPFSSTPLISPLSKATFPTLCAAFTSSSQNIALTTAMVAPPTPKPSDSPRDDADLTGSDKFSIHVVSSSPSVDSLNDSCGAKNSTFKTSNDNSNETTVNSQSQESNSSTKSIRATQKMMSHQTKSPKSPGFSPRNTEPTKTTSKRSNNRTSRSQRGKAKSKNRGHNYAHGDFMGGIQNNLVGTVYDFDDEIANDSVDLRALRDKRKSLDIHDKKGETLRDTSQSPHVTSPPNNKKAPQVADSREAKLPSPAEQISENRPVDSPARRSVPEPGQSPAMQPAAVQPVLPGPVNMRTYQATDAVPPGAVATQVDSYQSHFLPFGASERTLTEIYEVDEKQLQKNPVGSNDVPPATPIQPAVVCAAVPEPIEPPLPKVSLSDPRNQLKVKIKGPFLDANYATHSAKPAPPQPPAPVHDTSTNIVPNVGTSSMMAGTTNLRRMRKKELLRQYWTQDMNMDEPMISNTIGIVPPAPLPPPLGRAVITIPKAVSSMTSIPTRDDYMTDTIEKKKRKTTSGLSRELRHLEVGMNDDVDHSDDRCSSFTSSTNYSYKKRGRISTKPSKSVQSPITPKLKIKLGNIVQNTEEQTGYQFRPPKKRLASIPKPSIEDLRRESMKYRRMVMANFEEDEKAKKHKPSKSDKRKKKKDKKAKKLQVVNSESESATKLIIKIKRTKEQAACASKKAQSSRGSTVVKAGRASASATVTSAVAQSAEPAVPVDPFEYDPTAPDPLAIDPPSYAEASSAMRKVRTAKVTPIRLKLSRSSEGSGYVMQGTGEAPAATSTAATSAAAATASNAGDQPSSGQAVSLSSNKHCEVR